MSCAGRWIRTSCCPGINPRWVFFTTGSGSAWRRLPAGSTPNMASSRRPVLSRWRSTTGSSTRSPRVIIGKALRDGHLWEKTGLSLNLSMNLSTTSLIGRSVQHPAQPLPALEHQPRAHHPRSDRERLRQGSRQVAGGADPLCGCTVLVSPSMISGPASLLHAAARPAPPLPS